MLTVPGLCWLCRMPLALGHWGICSVCSRAARTDKTLCPQCGLPATHSHLPCGRCLQKPLPWQRLLTVADYAPPLSPLIHQLKFSGNDSNLLIVFYVQIMPDDFVMQLHRF